MTSIRLIKGGRSGAPAALRSETFTGTVWGDPVLAESHGVLINSVSFAPRARTHWHSHDGGQVLIVTSGAGRVCDRSGNGGAIATGDIVFIEPGVEHWHGAGPESPMVHTAISLQGHEWLAAVTDDEYEQSIDAERKP